MVGGLAIRDATVDDAGVVGEIHVRAHRFAYRGVAPDAYLDALDPGRRGNEWRWYLVAPPPALRLWIAERDGSAIGFCGVEAPSPEEAAALPERTAVLRWIHLRPEHVGTGAGRRLMAHAVAAMRAEGYRHAVLWVLAGNARARRFYAAAGWAHDGVSRPRAFRAGARELTVEELRYARSLADPGPVP